jgi:hypothetical protein
MRFGHAFLLGCAGANFNTTASREETVSNLPKMRRNPPENSLAGSPAVKIKKSKFNWKASKFWFWQFAS